MTTERELDRYLKMRMFRYCIEEGFMLSEIKKSLELQPSEVQEFVFEYQMN
jgi:hypothetical protein